MWQGARLYDATRSNACKTPNYDAVIIRYLTRVLLQNRGGEDPRYTSGIH